MDGVELTSAFEDMDVDAMVAEDVMEDVEPTFSSEDAMDVDVDWAGGDDLNGRIRTHAFGIDGEFYSERITYLS
jgi:hypothetical protein